jgi:hypothetical protein
MFTNIQAVTKTLAFAGIAATLLTLGATSAEAHGGGRHRHWGHGHWGYGASPYSVSYAPVYGWPHCYIKRQTFLGPYGLTKLKTRVCY